MDRIIKEASFFVLYVKRAAIIFLLSLCLAGPGHAAGQDVTLQWDASIDAPYLQSYKIYYYTTPGDPGSLDTTDYAVSYRLEGGSPIAITPLTDPKPITVDKRNTQITLHFSDAGKIYYFTVAAVESSGVESIPAPEVSLQKPHPLPESNTALRAAAESRYRKADPARGAVDPPKKAPAEQGSKDTHTSQGEVAFQGDHYVIGPEDVLSIHVWREEAFTRNLPVRIDGKISLPLLDDIQAAGLTPLQLKEELVKKLRVFVENPNVTVTVMEANSFKVYVSGEVKLPGLQRIRSQMTLVKLIILAGGFTEWADQKGILIIRKEKGVTKRLTVNYRKILNGEEPDVPIKSGDTVIVR